MLANNGIISNKNKTGLNSAVGTEFETGIHKHWRNGSKKNKTVYILTSEGVLFIPHSLLLVRPPKGVGQGKACVECPK